MSVSPIFIHSLFRSGSTYLFKVFRRSDVKYCAYQEPLHEMSAFAAEDPKQLINGFGEAESKLNRHPHLSSGYFQELFDAWPAWKDSITEEMVYRGYFATDEAEVGTGFWKSLIAVAKVRPVFQECRTSGRIKAIKKALGGSHLFLWRNPWDQWWSYKINSYFNTANQLIINSDDVPAPLKLMLHELALPQYKQKDLGGAFAFYSQRPLTSEQSYLVFYMLWCLALREGANNADLLLNIDRLSESEEYQSEILSKMRHLGIDGVDFSDCQVPQGFYSKDHQTFFLAGEARVHLWLIEGGWTQSDLELIQSLREQDRPSLWSATASTLDPLQTLEQADRFQEMARRFETSVAVQAKALVEAHESSYKLIQEAECRAAQAIDREKHSQSQLSQALTIVQQAQEISQQAEVRANEAEERTQQAEISAAEQIARLNQVIDARKYELQQAHQANHYHWQLAEQRYQQIEALYNSRSWRITAPLRWPVHQLRLLKSHGLKTRLKSFLRKILRKINKALLGKPRLRYRLVQCAKAIGLYSTLQRLIHNLRGAVHVQHSYQGQNVEQLSPRARKIYQELQRAIARKKAEAI